MGLVMSATPAHAQFGGVVFDPSNYAQNILMRRDWLEAYDFATKRGAQFLDDYARSAAPFSPV